MAIFEREEEDGKPWRDDETMKVVGVTKR